MARAPVMLLGLSQCGGDDSNNGASDATKPSAGTSAAPSTAAPSSSDTASAGTTSATNGELTVGTSDTQRVWVQLTGGGESPFKGKAGQKVSFTGTVAAHSADFAAKVGVTPEEGADQLVAQKQHVEVGRAALKIAD